MLPTLKNNAATGYKGPVKIVFEGSRSTVHDRTLVACFGDFLVMGVYRIDGWYSIFFFFFWGGGGREDQLCFRNEQNSIPLILPLLYLNEGYTVLSA